MPVPDAPPQPTGDALNRREVTHAQEWLSRCVTILAVASARDPPFCAAVGPMPIKMLAAQICAFCAPMSPWVQGSLVYSWASPDPMRAAHGPLVHDERTRWRGEANSSSPRTTGRSLLPLPVRCDDHATGAFARPPAPRTAAIPHRWLPRRPLRCGHLAVPQRRPSPQRHRGCAGTTRPGSVVDDRHPPIPDQVDEDIGGARRRSRI